MLSRPRSSTLLRVGLTTTANRYTTVTELHRSVQAVTAKTSKVDDNRRLAQRLETRLRRLTLLAEPRPSADPLLTTARRALTRVHETAGRPPEVIRLRSAFVARRRPLPREEMSDSSRQTADLPPAVALYAPRGVALQLELVGLFLSQCADRGSPRRNGLLELPVGNSAAQLGTSWVDVLVMEASVSDGNLVVTRESNRVRQIKSALESLTAPSVALVELPDLQRPRGKYDRVQLLHDGGARPDGAPVHYRVPGAREAVVTVPVNFFTQGWIHVLTNAEIATWLSLRHYAQTIGAGDEETGMMITGSMRKSLYGINKEAWGSHRMLERFGLLRVATNNRRRNGQLEHFDPEAKNALPNSVWLTDEGLSQDALYAVRAGLADAAEGARRSTP